MQSSITKEEERAAHKKAAKAKKARDTSGKTNRKTAFPENIFFSFPAQTLFGVMERKAYPIGQPFCSFSLYISDVDARGFFSTFLEVTSLKISEVFSSCAENSRGHDCGLQKWAKWMSAPGFCCEIFLRFGHHHSAAALLFCRQKKIKIIYRLSPPFSYPWHEASFSASLPTIFVPYFFFHVSFTKTSVCE